MKNNGVLLYKLISKILIGCGIGWLMLAFILDSNMYLYIVALLHICLGLFLFLVTKSKSFSNWANDDYKKSLEERKKLEKKVKLGKIVLPMTHGDLLALKISGIIIFVIVVVLILQG